MVEAEAYTGDLKDKDTRNWVKCTLGLHQLAVAVKGHVNETFDDYFKNGNRFLSVECCHIHYGPGCPCLNSEGYCECCKGGHKGSCSQHMSGPCHHVVVKKGILKISFQCNPCESALAQLQKLIKRGGTANWDNIYFPDVFKSSWAVAKIYMPRGNGTTDNPEQADAHCLLTIMKNCTLFKADDFLLKKVLEMRNEMIHQCALKVDDQTTKYFFQLAINFLHDIQEKNNYRCEVYIERLERFQHMVVTAEIYHEAIEKDIQDLLNYIKGRLANGDKPEELMGRLRTAIKTQAEQTLKAKNQETEAENTKLSDLIKKYEEDLRKAKAQLDMREDRIRQLESNLEQQSNIGRINGEELQRIRNANEVQCRKIHNLVVENQRKETGLQDMRLENAWIRAEWNEALDTIFVGSILAVIFLTLCL